MSFPRPSTSRFVYFPLICLGFLITGLGCTDPDPIADYRVLFEDLKKHTGEVDALLASIKDEASAREVIPELKEKLKLARETGYQISEFEKLTSRSATGLKNQIRRFREERKLRYREELRRLSRMSEVEQLLVPVLKTGGEDNIPQIQGPPEV